MSEYVGDIRLGDTIDVKFTTVNSSGVPTTLAGSPVISAYVDNGTTEITAGITLTTDFDSRTGMHNVRVVASSGNGFATSTNVDLVITTGTVSGSSVVGYVIASFSIEKRSAVMPTTAARTLDVSSTGEAGVDWANVGSPTTTVGLSGTTVKTATDVETKATDIQARLPVAVNGTSDSGSTTTMVDAARTEADTDYWKGCLIQFTSGTLLGQTRLITAFNAATDTITFAPATTVAVGTQTYIIWPYGRTDIQSIADNAIGAATLAADTITASKIASGAFTAAKFAADTGLTIRTGTAQSGSTSTTIKLDSGADTHTDWYVGSMVITTGGTGAGQVKPITAYDGSTKVATIGGSWPVTPDFDTTFSIVPMAAFVTAIGGSVITAGVIAANAIGASELASDAVAEIVAAVWDELVSTARTGGSIGERLSNLLRAEVITSWTGATNSGSGTNDLNLPSGLSTLDNAYKGCMVVNFINDPTKLEFNRVTSSFYNGGSPYVLCDHVWVHDPDGTGTAILVGDALSSLRTGAGNATTITALASGIITASNIAADTDVYTAKVWLTDDDTGTSDRYAAAWYKNGQLVTSGITSPLIQVYKIADATDLVASTAMTQIGSKGTYRYVEATNRIVNGVGYMIQVDATIGGSNRTAVQPFGRPTS